VYTLADYGRMAADAVRVRSYAQALQQAVRPGAVVANIGTGTGLFALLACQCGARRVYAIEPDDIIEAARALAAANRCADRITFIQDLSTRVNLPERADVIVSDLRGVLPLYGQHLPSIIDARKRLLAPGGILIPQRDTIWVAPVEAPELHAEALTPWNRSEYGLDYEPFRRLATNTWSKARVSPDRLLAPELRWATLDYTGVDHPGVGAELSWTVSRRSTGHGFIAWFDAVLIEGVGFSTGPQRPEMIYGSGYFPWPEPVGLEAGDVVTVGLHADLIGREYVWRWETRVRDQAHETPRAQFSQSNFQGTPMGPRLHARASTHVPSLNQDGRIDLAVVGLMDGQRTLEEIARGVAERFPDVFPTWRDAIDRVRDLSARYST
jgi:protein arginine N-methyltransferase 1